MTDEDALLAAICATPADDTARLVFADYLQEHGGSVNAAWALFIRGQVELARAGESCDPTAAARVRLLDVPFWRARWWVRLRFADARLACAEWVRGFPLSVSGSADLVRGAWPRLAARVPFEKLEVTLATDADVEDLVARPGLDRVRDLFLRTDHMNQAPLGDRAFLALAGCPALRGLRALAIEYAQATDVGVAAVLASPHLANLTTFSAITRQGRISRNMVSADLRLRLDRRFGEFAYY